ncbi:MAG: hypothetical protein AB1Z98_08400 [Nannocystaceae bacterium]
MIPSLVTLVIAPALLASTPAAPGPREAMREVALEVDHSALLDHQVPEAAQDTAFFVRSDSTALLRERYGLQVHEGADPELPAIIVRMAWVDYEESQYRVTIATQRPGEPVRMLEQLDCECVGSELTTAIAAKLPAALQQLDEPAPEPSPTIAEPEPEPATTADPGPEPPTPARIGPVGWAGVGVGGVGAAVLIGGLVLLPRDPVTRGDPGMVDERLPRELGVGLAIGGSVALAAGASMLVVDLVRRRPSRVAVHPYGGRGQLGAAASVRF